MLWHKGVEVASPAYRLQQPLREVDSQVAVKSCRGKPMGLPACVNQLTHATGDRHNRIMQVRRRLKGNL